MLQNWIRYGNELEIKINKNSMITLKIDNYEQTIDDQVRYMQSIIDRLDHGFTSGTNWEISGSEEIRCACEDGSCSDSTGPEGKVADHIENCDYSHCHHELGKL